MAFEGAMADRVALGELNASYGHAVAQHDLDGFAALWAEDAVWTHPQYGALTGRSAIVEVVRAAFDAYPLLVFFGQLGQLIVDGDGARGTLYVNELAGNQTGEVGRVAGRYEDRYVRRNGRWLFAERHYHIYHWAETDAWPVSVS